MLEFHIMFSSREDAHKANDRICLDFVGMNSFINDEIIITVVKPEYVKREDGTDQQFWAFDICFADENIDRKIVLTAGEVSVMGIKKIWAINRINNYVTGESKEE